MSVIYSIHQGAEAPYSVSVVCTSTSFDLSLVTSGVIKVHRQDHLTIDTWTTILADQSATGVTLVHALVAGDVDLVETVRLVPELTVPSGLLVGSAETLKVHDRSNRA